MSYMELKLLLTYNSLRSVLGKKYLSSDQKNEEELAGYCLLGVSGSRKHRDVFQTK